jgi:hypothetical protein
MISLADTANALYVDIWLVFRNVPGKRSPFWRLLKNGFRHIEVWRLDRGAWVRMDGCYEITKLEIYTEPPWLFNDSFLQPTYTRVRRVVKLNRLRDPFMFGPMTCVEMAKSAIGMWAPFVRTPYQLYKRIHREARNGRFK